MRKDPFFVGDIVHVFNRGNRKQKIVRDKKDKWHFLQMFFYFNDEYSTNVPLREVRDILKSDFYTKLIRPTDWPLRDPLVKILAFIVVDNHYHLILEEIKENGISRFMQKIGNSMTGYFNSKYEESGRLFQGSYKAKRVDDDNYLQYLAVYIMVKNAFEMYPGGIKNAMKNFDDAYDFAVKYLYGSLSSYAGGEISPIIDEDMLKTAFPTPKDMKDFAEGCLNFIYFDEKTNMLDISIG